MASLCDICCEAFNNSNRSSVKCMYADCGFIACKACIRQYIIGNSTTSAHCMKCKKQWTTQFMVLNLNRTFVEKEYTNHHRNLLIEREISKLPDTMAAAEFTKKSFEAVKPLQDEVNKLKNKLRQVDTYIGKYKTTRNALNIKIQARLDEIADLERHAYRQVSNTTNAKERRKFIMQCPSESCRGFLSTQYKCELCSTHTCPKCFEVIGTDKNVEHTCLEANVKSAELIRKDTKPCPSCGTRISKISGCDQMWCTECHQAFSWNRGTIETGTIHNPHFYDYKRNQNNGIIPRAPGDVLCGGLCTHYELQNVMNRIIVAAEDTVTLQVFHGNNGRISHLIPGVIKKFIDVKNGKIKMLIESKEDTKNDEVCQYCSNVACNLNKYKHVFEYQHDTNNTAMFGLSTKPKLYMGVNESLRNLHQLINHLTISSLRTARANSSEAVQEADNRISRIKYILGEISKDELACQTHRAYKKKQKNIELLHIYEILNVSGIELFTNLINSQSEGDEFKKQVINNMSEFRRLSDYCNEQLQSISMTYNMKVEQICDDWKISNKQFGIRRKTNNTNAQSS